MYTTSSASAETTLRRKKGLVVKQTLRAFYVRKKEPLYSRRAAHDCIEVPIREVELLDDEDGSRREAAVVHECTLVEQIHHMEEETTVFPPSPSLRDEGRVPHELHRAADEEEEELLDDEDGSRRRVAVVHECMKCVH